MLSPITFERRQQLKRRDLKEGLFGQADGSRRRACAMQ